MDDSSGKGTRLSLYVKCNSTEVPVINTEWSLIPYNLKLCSKWKRQTKSVLFTFNFRTNLLEYFALYTNICESKNKGNISSLIIDKKICTGCFVK